MKIDKTNVQVSDISVWSIADVNNCSTWKPTMCLRWYETDNYKVLQQKWKSSTGEERWEDIEVYGR